MHRQKPPPVRGDPTPESIANRVQARCCRTSSAKHWPSHAWESGQSRTGHCMTPRSSSSGNLAVRAHYLGLAVMKEIVSTVTEKGQVTIPAEVRRTLGIHRGEKVIFLIEGGDVRLKPVRFTLETVFGSVPALPSRDTVDFDEQIDEAMEEEAEHIVGDLQ